jgi:LDH2 family malate/lactate/ureidoglycolate dehydrogenase
VATDKYEVEFDTEVELATARALVQRVMETAGFTEGEAGIITDQIIECELRGVPNAGLSRALSLHDIATRTPRSTGMRVTRETPVSALIEGRNTCGYLVAHAAVELAIAKAEASGVAVVAANDTWYTGMYVHYLEAATRAGLVGIAMGNSGPHVAPYGSVEAKLGTNPIAFGFPSRDDPIIFDAGTSSLVLSELHMAARLGRSIPDGHAFDPEGQPTIDPALALAGAIKVWGGYRGYGLSVAVHLLGILAGASAPGEASGHGFMFIALRPDLFGDADSFLSSISAFSDSIRLSRPEPGGRPVRMPFDRSAKTRRDLLARGSFPTSRRLIDQLQERAMRG